MTRIDDMYQEYENVIEQVKKHLEDKAREIPLSNKRPEVIAYELVQEGLIEFGDAFAKTRQDVKAFELEVYKDLAAKELQPSRKIQSVLIRILKSRSG